MVRVFNFNNKARRLNAGSLYALMDSDLNLKYVGAVFLILVSGLILVYPEPNIFIPLPIHLGILLYIFGPFGILVIPLSYFLFLWLFSRVHLFGNIILVHLAIFSVISIFYFFSFWEVGIEIQGKTFLWTTIFENLILVISSSFLAFRGIKENSSKFLHFSVLTFFFMISWCAFPILGLFP